VSDVQQLRDLAQRVRELASQTRGAAAQLRQAQDVRFVSNAAERYRADLRSQAASTEGAARQLDDAANALMHHAAQVEATLARIKAIEHWFANRLHEAKNELVHAVGAITHAASEILAHAPRAPAPGSPDWIEFGRRWRL